MAGFGFGDVSRRYLDGSTDLSCTPQTRSMMSRRVDRIVILVQLIRILVRGPRTYTIFSRFRLERRYYLTRMELSGDVSDSS